MELTKNQYFENYITFGQGNLTDVVHNAIIEKSHDRMIILKTAVLAGLNVSSGYLLHVAVQKNDIAAVAYLVQCGANLNNVHGNMPLLHRCVNEGMYSLLKYFIEKGADIEKVDDGGDTALLVASICGQVECAKILLEKGANVNFINDKKTAVSWILNIMTNEEVKHTFQKYTDILKMIVVKKKKILLFELDDVLQLIDNEYFEAFQILVDNYPHIINLYLGEYKDTMLFHAINLKKYKFIDYLLTRGIDFTKKDGQNATYLHKMAHIGYVNGAEIILKKRPAMKDILDDNGRTCIEYALIPYDISTDAKKEESEIIKLVELFAKYGVNINNKNSYGWHPLECSIQFNSHNVTEKIIALKAKLDGIKNHINFFPTITNNDPVSFATQMGKLETVQLLLDKNAVFQMHYSKKHDIDVPIPLIISVTHSQTNILSYLLENEKIKKFVTEKTKKYLYNIATEEGCTDKNLLMMLEKKRVVNSLEFSDKYIVNGLKRHIAKYISNNDDTQELVLTTLYTLSFIFYLIFTDNKKKSDAEYIVRIAETIYEPSEISNNNSLIDQIITIFASRMVQTKQSIINQSLSIIEQADNPSKIYNIKELFSDDEKCNLLKFHVVMLYATKRIRVSKKKYEIEALDFRNDSKCIEDSETEDNSDTPISEDSENSDSSEDLVFTKKALFKMLWPTRLLHYENMCDLVLNNSDICRESKNEIVTTSPNGLISTIYKTIEPQRSQFKDCRQIDKPLKWFKTYAPNIGSLEKQDDNHTFSYLLDTKICSLPCIEKKSRDAMHPEKCNSMFYFYGELKTKNGNKITGCYEYFINGYRTLFHRMFRPYDELPEYIKDLLPNN